MRKLVRYVSISALTAVLLALTAQGLHAATLTVSNTLDSGAGSLRSVLAAASDGDTISFFVTGTITLTTGQLVVGKNVTITGPGAASLSVNGNATSRVFYISPGKIATIDGLTITNGRAVFSSLDDDAVGGGILNDRGTLTITNCNVSGNAAEGHRGNGVYNQGPATMTIISSTISHNATGDGNAVYNQSPVSGNGVASMTILSSTISDNAGIGVANDGSGSIGINTGTNIATMTVTNSTVSGNNGPGIWQGGGFHFTNNGTRYNGNATLTVTNSTISGNAPYCGLGSSIANIAANGITSAVTIGNTILEGGIDDGFNPGNISLVAYADATATITSLGYNLSSDSAVIREYADPGPTPTPAPTPDTGTGPGGILNALGDVRNTNPLLGTLQNNGGPTFTHALQPGSPAINAGGSSIVSGFDQRGAGFARVSGGRIDIGAFEVQTTVCPQPQGYWKNNPDAWPVSSLMIGGHTYTKAELLAILRTPAGTGKNADASLILAYQLIAAKLNEASGADITYISGTINSADLLLATFDGRLPYRVKPSTAAGQSMVGYGRALEAFNKGTTTAGCTL